MRFAEHVTVAGWEITRPAKACRAPGVSMAGFRSRAGTVDVRVVPHPSLTLALEFGHGPTLVDTATSRRQRGNLVAGFLSGGFRVRGDHVECLQVRLSPLAARAVLGVAPAELDQTTVALHDLWGADEEPLRQRLADAASWPQRFALVDAVLARRIATGPELDRKVAWVWHRIHASRGRLRIDELAAELGWSRKRLWQRFRSQIGLSPKYTAKLVRFDHAVHQLAAGTSAARVAAANGYVDQPHLYRDVLAFTGTTPTVVAREQWLAADGAAWTGRQRIQSVP